MTLSSVLAQNSQTIALSIVIKTLNEERNIARCIEVILGTFNDIKYEIIVADSGSNDCTIEIASNYPVTIVQLANPAEKSCGIGPQLGFQHSHGEFVLILDADMVLHVDFVKRALSRMEIDKRCAAIGGQLFERTGTGYEYEHRNSQTKKLEEKVNWLDGCGIYRRKAIESVGYFTNRNLHAYEEKELGLRLKYAGWHMYRIVEVAVDHYGHSVDTVQLLWRRWRSGYADACGESIRACFGKPYLMDMVLVHKTLVICLIFQIFFLTSILTIPWFLAPFKLLGVLLIVGMMLQVTRKKGIKNGIYSLLYTNIFALGLARGIFKTQVNPLAPIKSVVFK